MSISDMHGPRPGPGFIPSAPLSTLSGSPPMPINVTLTTHGGALWWGQYKVAPEGDRGRLPEAARLILVAAGLISGRLRRAFLRVCEQCGEALLASPSTRYCRPCRLLVRRQNEIAAKARL